MNFDQYWEPKLNEQIEFRVLDVDDDGEILRRTDTLIGWVWYYGGNRHTLVRASIPVDTHDYDYYDVRSDPYTRIREPKYYRPVISGDLILYDGLTLLFNMWDNYMGYGMVNLSKAFPDMPARSFYEMLQTVKTIDFSREYTYDEVLDEIERYMML